MCDAEDFESGTLDDFTDFFARHGRQIRIGKQFVKAQKSFNAALRLLNGKT